MIIKSISYSQSIERYQPTGLKLWNKASIEADLEPGEDVQAKLSTIKGLVEDFLSKGDVEYGGSLMPLNSSHPSMQPPIINREAERVAILIENAKDKLELSGYAFNADKYGLNELYDKRFNELP